MFFFLGATFPILKILRADNLNIYDVLVADTIVATATALEKIQEVYGE